ncbi:MAG: ATP-binding protein, partial [Actinomycetota bacterium]
MAECARCRAENPPDGRFCMACGAALGVSCDACGKALPAQAMFCSNCGVAVSARTGDAAETIKLVTVLFADVVGSTAQAETMRPEDTRALMAQLFDAMSEEILAEGGTVERIIGDAIMADFGVPIAREDDPVRAVRAALRMYRRLDGFNAARPDEELVQMRIGINTGAVSTGGSFGERLLVMGDAVNVAARLEQAAAPGTILIGEKTARAVRRNFRLERVESVIAKGKSLPVQAFAVQEEVEAVEENALRPAPLLGREKEMELLGDLFDGCARDRVQQVCTVIGDAGVGKSRLLSEFVSSIEEGATVLRGRCPPYGDGLTLAPLQEILRTEARIFPQDDAETSMAKLVRLVSNAAPKLSPSDALAVSAPLGSTIGLSPAIESMADLDPRVVYREMLRSWRLYLSALTAPGPVVLVVEDIHWADQTLLDVLADLSEHIEGAFLMVCSARAEFLVGRSGWLSRLHGHSSLQLEALPRSDARDLVGELLGTSDLPSDLVERILERAEGNPLFIEEFLLRLVDEGCLSVGPQGWYVTGDVSDIEVPERVQTLIQARLDLLSPLEREVLQAAAVVGRHFWSGALQWVTGLPDAPEIVERLKPRQMVIEPFSSSVPGDVEYAFRHALIRDVVYENLPRKARARAHAAAARWIESVRGARAEESAELLADHFERAYEDAPDDTLRTRARHYLLLAAGAAMRRFAVDQAERLGYRAVELSLPGAERAEALEGLGDAFHLALRGNPAWNAYTSALAELDESGVDAPDRVARLAAKAAIVPTRWIGTLDEDVSVAEIKRVIGLGLQAADRDGRDRVLLLSARAFLAGTVEEVSVSDHEGAEEAAREAVALAEGLGDVNLLSTAMDAVGVLLWPTGRFREITQVDRDRLQLLPELSDIREIADILLSAGRDLTR